MSEQIVFIDKSHIVAGKLEELKLALKELSDFVDANEPRPISYAAYLSHDETELVVLQIHPDSASMELHMQMAASIFPRFKDLLTLNAMEVYGDPSEPLMAQIKKKVDLLGRASIAVHHQTAGFARY